MPSNERSFWSASRLDCIHRTNRHSSDLAFGSRPVKRGGTKGLLSGQTLAPETQHGTLLTVLLPLLTLPLPPHASTLHTSLHLPLLAHVQTSSLPTSRPPPTAAPPPTDAAVFLHVHCCRRPQPLPLPRVVTFAPPQYPPSPFRCCRPSRCRKALSAAWQPECVSVHQGRMTDMEESAKARTVLSVRCVGFSRRARPSPVASTPDRHTSPCPGKTVRRARLGAHV